MGVSKVILNGQTLIDVTQKTVTADNLLSPNTALDAAGSNVVGEIATKTASNLSASGSIVTVPSGYYAADASKAIAAGTATTPATTISVTPTISLNSSTGVISIGISGSSSITPTVTAGYISSGTAGTVSVSGSSTLNLTTKAAASYTPSASTQTIAAGVYLTGAQTINPIPISVDNHRLILPEGLISV